MTISLYHVDAFTDKPFAGNPAAVCLLNEPREDAWLAHVAQEMNLSETAFLWQRAGREDGYDLRWFTPAIEVDLCGHATLASAHILWETGALRSEEQARFHTRSGLLTAQRRGAWIELDFPATPAEPVEVIPALNAALGVTPVFSGKTRFDYLLEVDSEAALRAIRPDFATLRSLGVRGVIVTSRAATGEYNFVSRFFAPGAGVDEDPVTGSAHCALAPYWSAKLGKSELLAYQASARGGVVRVHADGARVHLGGQAVTVLRGELTA